jgi:selenocysteine lyase/cysteine desulfurase
LVASGEALARGLPLLRGGGAVRLVSLDDVSWAAPPHRYEAGTPNTVGAIALGAACDALTAHGLDRIHADELELSERLWAGLGSIGGVEPLRMWTATVDRVGVAAFVVEGREPRVVADELATRFGIAVRSGAFCAHPLVAHLLGVEQQATDELFVQLAGGEEILVPGAVRASVGIGVSAGEIDLLLDALEQIASGR